MPSFQFPPKKLQIPNFLLPSLVSTIGARLPQWPSSLGLCAALNLAVKIRLIPEDRLGLLEGKKLSIDVTDTGNTMNFTVKSALFLPMFSVNDTPDLLFRASLASFLQLMSRQEDPDTLFFNRSLVIEGDTALGLTLKNMFDAIEWPNFKQFFEANFFKKHCII